MPMTAMSSSSAGTGVAGATSRPLAARFAAQARPVGGVGRGRGRRGAQMRGDRADGGVLEQVGERHLAAQHLAEPPTNPPDAQRVATQIEEVVVDTDVGHAQHLAPHGRDRAFQLRPRRHRRRGRRRARALDGPQAAQIEPAVGAPRQADDMKPGAARRRAKRVRKRLPRRDRLGSGRRLRDEIGPQRGEDGRCALELPADVPIAVVEADQHLARGVCEGRLERLERLRGREHTVAAGAREILLGVAATHADLVPQAPGNRVRAGTGRALVLREAIEGGVGGGVSADPESAEESIDRGRGDQDATAPPGEQLVQRPRAAHLGAEHRAQARRRLVGQRPLGEASGLVKHAVELTGPCGTRPVDGSAEGREIAHVDHLVPHLAARLQRRVHGAALGGLAIAALRQRRASHEEEAGVVPLEQVGREVGAHPAQTARQQVHPPLSKDRSGTALQLGQPLQAWDVAPAVAVRDLALTVVPRQLGEDPLGVSGARARGKIQVTPAQPRQLLDGSAQHPEQGAGLRLHQLAVEHGLRLPGHHEQPHRGGARPRQRLHQRQESEGRVQRRALPDLRRLALARVRRGSAEVQDVIGLEGVGTQLGEELRVVVRAQRVDLERLGTEPCEASAGADANDPHPLGLQTPGDTRHGCGVVGKEQRIARDGSPGARLAPSPPPPMHEHRARHRLRDRGRHGRRELAAHEALAEGGPLDLADGRLGDVLATHGHEMLRVHADPGEHGRPDPARDVAAGILGSRCDVEDRELVGVTARRPHGTGRDVGDVDALHLFGDGLDLVTVVVEAVDDDDVLLPPGDGQLTVVDPPEIAGREPAVGGERLRVEGRIAEVA
jgi:hypothetical protein